MAPSSYLRVTRRWFMNSAHWAQTKTSKFNQIPIFKHKPKKMKTVRHCNLKTTISRRRGSGRDTWDQEPNIPSFNHSNAFRKPNHKFSNPSTQKSKVSAQGVLPWKVERYTRIPKDLSGCSLTSIPGLLETVVFYMLSRRTNNEDREWCGSLSGGR